MKQNFLVLTSWIFLFIVAWGTAYIAHQRGRQPVLWFIIGLFFGLFGLVALLFVTRKKKTAALPVQNIPLSVPDELLKEWFFVDKDRMQQGPFGFHTLKSKWSQNAIDSLTLVWSEGMEKWIPIKDMPEQFKTHLPINQ